MEIIIESKRKKLEKLKAKYPRYEIIDLTSKGSLPWVKFSPFYPHGEIPVPQLEGSFSCSMEGIWQGLKVFEGEGVDVSKFSIQNMKGIKRTVRKCGRVLGHQYGETLLSYQEAREKIYLPSYRWVLENCLLDEINSLEELGKEKGLVFLDYETNQDITDLRKPLSHASLVKRFLEEKYFPHGEVRAKEKMGICPLCHRSCNLTFHHLIPKKVHRRNYFKKNYSKQDLSLGVDICRLCHSGIHDLYDQMTLGKTLYTAELLKQDFRIQKHATWVGKQKVQKKKFPFQES